MAEAVPDQQLEDENRSVLGPSDWADFQQRKGGDGAVDFFLNSPVSAPEADGDGGGKGAGGDGGEDPSKSPDKKGDGEPGGEEPGKKPEGDGEPGGEGPGEEPETGDGDPSDKKPSGRGDEMPPGFERRLKRQARKHERELTAERRRREALEARLAELDNRGGGDGGTGADDGGEGGKAWADMDAREQHEALGVAAAGPDPADYEKSSDWTEDFDLYLDDKPLKHHPKIEALSKRGAGGDSKPGGADKGADGGGDNRLTPEQLAVARRAELSWKGLEAAFEEKEEDEPDGGIDLDVYDQFVTGFREKKFPLRIEALAHLADSEDGPEMAKLLAESPAKAYRLFSKDAAAQAAELDKMLARARKRAGDGKGGDGGGGGKEAKRGGDVLPDLGGGSSGTGETDAETMSQEQYAAMRKRQQEASRNNFFI